MAEAPTETTTKKAPKPKLTGVELAKKRALRRKLKTAGRKKRSAKLLGDREAAKVFFEARSKRATDKKQLFRKKKSRKK